MKQYLLPAEGQFYKANLHCHTTVSDGAFSPEKTKEVYQQLGYAIVAYTDHDVLIAHDHLTDDSFLALHGLELEVNEQKGAPYDHSKTCHFCLIALDKGNLIHPLWHRTDYLFGNAPRYREQVKFDPAKPDYVRHYTGECISDMMQIAADAGFFVTYNHPTWSQESYPEYINYNGMHAMEIINGGCSCMGYEDYNPRVYDDMLQAGKRLFCIAADDNHSGAPIGSRRSDCGMAFTMIKAPSLQYEDITAALKAGHFYSSEGPEIHALWMEDGKVHIQCSPVDTILCNYDKRGVGSEYAENGQLLTEAVFELRPDMQYFRLTLLDAQGKHACTNAYFLEDFR